MKSKRKRYNGAFKSLFEKWLCFGCAEERAPDEAARKAGISYVVLTRRMSILSQSVNEEQRSLAVARPAGEANALFKQALRPESGC